MNKLQEKLKELKQRRDNYPALMTHVVLGYPSLSESMEIVAAMARAGAEIIEMQIPFSDPMADGPTIMSANEQALNNNVQPIDCFRAAKELSDSLATPLLFMTYFNIVYRFKGGVRGFCESAAKAGVQGLIVPDILIDDKVERYWELAVENNLSPIPIASPVSSDKRLKTIGHIGERGFIYCVSTTSTTGAKKELPLELPEYLRSVKKVVKCPIAVGFGISRPAHIRALSGLADIAVVGSATIELIKKTSKKSRISCVSEYIAALTGQ